MEPPAWQQAAKAAAAVVGVLVIGRYLTRPVLRIVAGTNIREVFTAFALLLVVGIAQLMSLAGISMALGAFLAGVLLASSEYRHALETDIEPFKGLLLGLFFISVGMTVDFGLLESAPLTIGELVAGLLLLKLATLWLVARIMGVGSRQRWLFAALLAQGGEFAFVVFGVAKLGGRPVRRHGGSADHRRGALDGGDSAHAPAARQGGGVAGRRIGTGGRRDRRAGQPGDHRRVRALRADRGPAAVRQRHARHRARSRPGADRSAAQVRLQGVLWRCHAARPAARGRRGERRVCW